MNLNIKKLTLSLVAVFILSIAYVGTSQLASNSEVSLREAGLGDFASDYTVVLDKSKDHYFTVGKEGFEFEQLEEAGLKTINNRRLAYVLTFNGDEKPEDKKRFDDVFYQLRDEWRKWRSTENQNNTELTNYFIVRTLRNSGDVTLNLPSHVKYHGSTKWNGTPRPWGEDGTVSQDIEVEFVSSSYNLDKSDVAGVSDSVTFEIEVDITATNEDVYVSDEARQPSEKGNGFVYSILDSGKADVASNVDSSADQVVNGFEVLEGATERFTLAVGANNFEKDGFYKLSLNGLTYSFTENGEQIYHNLKSGEFETDRVFINAGEVMATGEIKIKSPNGGEFFELGDTVKVTWESENVDLVDVYIDVHPSSVEYGSGNTNYLTNLKGQNSVGIPAERGYFEWIIDKKQLPLPGNLEIPQTYTIRVVSKDNPFSNIKDRSDNPFTVTGKTDTCNLNRDLTVGSSGSDVVAIQNFLEEKGLLSLPVGVAKGYFGSSTQAALSQFQVESNIYKFSQILSSEHEDFDIRERGYFGPLTRMYLVWSCKG
jgi:hypothetical protein